MNRKVIVEWPFFKCGRPFKFTMFIQFILRLHHLHTVLRNGTVALRNVAMSVRQKLIIEKWVTVQSH
jgi:hypothetical protein